LNRASFPQNPLTLQNIMQIDWQYILIELLTYIVFCIVYIWTTFLWLISKIPFWPHILTGVVRTIEALEGAIMQIAFFLHREDREPAAALLLLLLVVLLLLNRH
jgi:hypothetical protein